MNLKEDNSLARQYVLSLIYKQVPVTELFLSQRAVLPQLFSTEQSGVIVSIPTSSGKTRIAEMAILNTIIENPLRLAGHQSPAPCCAGWDRKGV